MTDYKEVELERKVKLNKAALIDPIVSENAARVLENRYLAKDDKGDVVEDAKGMYMRVAEAVAEAELQYNQNFALANMQAVKHATDFYNQMALNKFVPNSPTMMNAGRRLGMLSACFVVPVEDDLSDIMDSVKATAMIQRAGGGTGFSFSNLRPTNSIVASSGGTTSGPLSFIDIFSQTTSSIQQGAFRRGANMGLLSVRHPDIIAFIQAKSDLKRFQNYNVSASMPDAFMELLEVDPKACHEVWHDKWGKGSLLRNTSTGEIRAFRSEEAEELATKEECPWTKWSVQDTWDLICKRAWETGEPGLFFVDKVNRTNPIPNVGNILATNPCGEQPLHAWDSCTLGSINLAKFINDDFSINWDHLAETVGFAIRFLDNVITINKYPLPEIDKMSKETTRRIGLGVMGWADLLFILGIPYDSDTALDLAEEVMSFINIMSAQCSVQLGKTRGSFGAFKGSAFEGKVEARRNAFLTTVAPTGTISIIADCSGGIEPLYALSFTRKVMKDSNGKYVEMTETNPYFLKAVEAQLFALPTVKEELLKHVYKHGSMYDFRINDRNHTTIDIVANLQRVFKTAHEISPEAHVKMQAAFQKHVDSSISKTINLTHDHTPEVVAQVYRQAYDLDCKGITVYRDGSRDNKEGMAQPMMVRSKEETPIPVTQVKQDKIEFSPDFASAIRTQLKTSLGTLHLFLVFDSNNKPTEIFAQVGKGGQHIAADLEAICRLASLLLKSGESIDTIISQLDNIGTSTVSFTSEGKIYSLPDAVAKALKKVLPEVKDKPETKSDQFDSSYGIPCPACNKSVLVIQEGCKRCHNCDYTAC